MHRSPVVSYAVCMPKKKTRRPGTLGGKVSRSVAIAAEARLHASHKVWVEERDKLMLQIRDLNATLERLTANAAQWDATLRVMRAAKSLLLDQIARVNRKIEQVYA